LTLGITSHVLSAMHSYPMALPGTLDSFASIIVGDDDDDDDARGGVRRRLRRTWPWRVTCYPLRRVRSVRLSLAHVATLPLRIRVPRLVTAQGRQSHGDYIGIEIEAIRRTTDAIAIATTGEGGNELPPHPYISQSLNPLSGQRGGLALPVPFPLPALYEVTNPSGEDEHRHRWRW
jgi:hypothetical protein